MSHHSISFGNRLLAALSYSFAIALFLFVVMGRRDESARFIFFHAWQSVGLWLFSVAAFGLLEYFNPFKIEEIYGIAFVFLLGLLVILALMGKKAKVPLIGHLAAKLSKI